MSLFFAALHIIYFIFLDVVLFFSTNYFLDNFVLMARSANIWCMQVWQMGFPKNGEKRAQGCIQAEEADHLQAISIKKTNIVYFHPCVSSE